MGQYYRCIIYSEAGFKTLAEIPLDASKLDWQFNGCSNLHNKIASFIHSNGPCRPVMCGDYATYGDVYYDGYNEPEELFQHHHSYEKDFIFINVDKKQYIKNPLDIFVLIANSNGRGGSDYYGPSEHLAGTWAGDIVDIVTEMPEGYEEVSIEY